jgi:hypothetical protein
MTMPINLVEAVLFLALGSILRQKAAGVRVHTQKVENGAPFPLQHPTKPQPTSP